MVDTMYAGLPSRRLLGFVGALAAIAAGAALADAAPSIGTGVPVVAAAKPVPLPSGQVWECMVNGQRTFSDVRCGTQSTVRQLSPINIMNVASTRPSATYGSYPTGYYAPRPIEPATPEESAADYANDAYWGPGVIAVNPRPIRGHHGPQSNHGHGRARRN
jgi:hypothetical protein